MRPLYSRDRQQDGASAYSSAEPQAARLRVCIANSTCLPRGGAAAGSNRRGEQKGAPPHEVGALLYRRHRRQDGGEENSSKGGFDAPAALPATLAARRIKGGSVGWREFWHFRRQATKMRQVRTGGVGRKAAAPRNGGRLLFGLPDRIRTCDLQSRSLTRYPAGLRVDILFRCLCSIAQLFSKVKCFSGKSQKDFRSGQGRKTAFSGLHRGRESGRTWE